MPKTQTATPTAPAAGPAEPKQEPQAPAPEAKTPAKVGTTDTLFPNPQEEQPPKEQEAPAKPTPAAPKPSAPAGKKTVSVEVDENGNILNFDALGDLRVPVKVDGQESVETLHKLKRGHQLDSHLSQKGERLNRQIDEKMTALRSLEQDVITRITATGNDPKVKSDDPAVQELQKQLGDIQKTLRTPPPQAAAPSHKPAPSAMETREQVISMVKQAIETRGYQEFDKYWPRLESRFLSLPPDQQQRFTNPDAWVAEFLDIKSKEQSPTAPPANAAPSQTVAGGPNVTVVEPGGGGGSPASSAIENWEKRYDAQLELAKKLSLDQSKGGEAMRAWAELDAIRAEKPQPS